MSKSNIVVIKLLLGILFSSINFLYAQSLPDWENPDVICRTTGALKGRAMVAVKSNHSSGDFNLTVTSPGLADAEINIKSIIIEKQTQ
jgi:hypothetical protein